MRHETAARLEGARPDQAGDADPYARTADATLSCRRGRHISDSRPWYRLHMHTTHVVEAPLATGALCSQIAGDPAGDVIHQLLGAITYERRVIDLTADLSLVPSLGSLRWQILGVDQVGQRRFLRLEHDTAGAGG